MRATARGPRTRPRGRSAGGGRACLPRSLLVARVVHWSWALEAVVIPGGRGASLVWPAMDGGFATFLARQRRTASLLGRPLVPVRVLVPVEPVVPLRRGLDVRVRELVERPPPFRSLPHFL